MKKKIEIDEIDLIQVFINIWNNKLKIAVITLIFVFLSVGQYFIFKPKFTAKTEILPINIFENNLYSSYNSLLAHTKKSEDQRISNINKNYLLNLFLEEMQTKEIVVKAIKDFQLIDRKKFDNEDKYLKAVKKKALKLDLLRPVNVDGKSKKVKPRVNWTIKFQIYDVDKWESALRFIENEINNKIQKYLKGYFNTTLNNLKLLDQFELEDLDLKIKNLKNDYDTETNNRIAFLKEQELIARKLNIENNTLEVENFSTSSGVISTLQTAKPYYMRGYSMIEKGIELIETRTNKDAFTKDLFDLEKQRRTLLEDKSLKRIERLFNATPIFTTNDFKAAKIVYQNTEYKTSFTLIKTILIAGFFGITFGLFYVYILIGLQKRK